MPRSSRPLLLSLLALFCPSTMNALPIEIGSPLPSPNATDQDGNPVDWSALAKEGFTLVYFYPKADTPGCTKQACSLRDAHEELARRGVRVAGVSGDQPAAQKRFQTKHALPFLLVADTSGAVADAFGVPRVGSFAARQAFLFRNGTLVWRDLKASTDRQAADVLAAIDALPKP